MRRIVLLTALSVALGAGLIGGFYVASGTGAPLPADVQYETTTTGCSGAPGNLVPPAITGTITVGTQLHASTGTWDCDPTEFHYQWSTPSESGFHPAGSDAPDVTVLFETDFFVTVKACNQVGCAEYSACIRDNDANIPAKDQYGNAVFRCDATTSPQPPPPPNPCSSTPDGVTIPRNLTPPTITGTITVGETLHVSTGTWTCDPTSFRIGWFAYNHPFTSFGSPDLVVPFLDDFGVTVTGCVNNDLDCSFASSACIRDPNNPADNQYDNPADIQYGGPDRLGNRCPRTSG